MTTRKGKSRKPRPAVKAAEDLLARATRPLMAKAIQLALSGDAPMLRLLLDRAIPERKSRPIAIKLPDTKTAAGVTAALDAIIAKVGVGELAMDDALALSTIVDRKRRAIELLDIEHRLARLEGQR